MNSFDLPTIAVLLVLCDLPQITICPADEDETTRQTIASMKRGSRRKRNLLPSIQYDEVA